MIQWSEWAHDITWTEVERGPELDEIWEIIFYFDDEILMGDLWLPANWTWV
jgi:hypothetical protein